MDQKSIPTICDATNFDIEKDTAALRKAMKGLGTDEKTVINILTAISNSQRRELIEYYNRTLERNLMDDLKSELSGNFRDAIKALMAIPNEYLCKHIKRQLKLRYNLNNVLTEILFPRSRKEISDIVLCFRQMYPYTPPLAEEVQNKAPEDFRNMFQLMLQGGREPTGAVDEAKVKKQAEELVACKDLKPSSEALYHLLAAESFAQLRLVFAKYQELAGHSVKDSIKRESLVGPQLCLYSLVTCVESVPTFFAARLHQALDKDNLDHGTLIRIIVSRSEIDLGNIKQEYERIYQKSLLSDVSERTSGDYKHTMCAIIGA